jgi:hypothetical protein
MTDHTATAAAYIATLSSAERHRLRALAQDDRAAFTEALKAGGAAKMGVRLKVELLLQEGALDVSDVSDPSSTAAGTVADADAAATPAAEPAAAAEDLPAKLTSAFVAATAFAGARAGYAFKMGSKGLGYYHDDPLAIMDPAEARIKRGFTGNLSWLSEQEEAPPQEAEEAPAPAAEPAPKPAAAKSYPLALPGSSKPREPIASENGRLSERRRKMLEIQAGPYAPDLREGKYADMGHVVRINGKFWAHVFKIELHSYCARSTASALRRSRRQLRCARDAAAASAATLAGPRSPAPRSPAPRSPAPRSPAPCSPAPRSPAPCSLRHAHLSGFSCIGRRTHALMQR